MNAVIAPSDGTELTTAGADAETPRPEAPLHRSVPPDVRFGDAAAMERAVIDGATIDGALFGNRTVAASRFIAGAHAAAAPRIGLLGTGIVGSAVVQRAMALRARGVPVPEIAWLSNSRAVRTCDGDGGAEAALAQARAVPQAEARAAAQQAETLRAGDVLIDATASEAVAVRHASWLARGIHVVTANKLGIGADAVRADAIAAAQCSGNAQYGDAATVGAGLPLLRSIRELVAGGDRIHAIEGVLSGSLAWLFSRYTGAQAFSALVREARDAGYTEPDPRADLCGEDVRRKLLILARAAGIAIDADAIAVDSLVPAPLALVSDVEAVIDALDAPMAERAAQASAAGMVLRFVGRVDARGARVGLQALDPCHPLCGGSGTDNRVAIFSDRYCTQPLVVQGPGAGAEVTAAALLDDVLRITRA